MVVLLQNREGGVPAESWRWSSRCRNWRCGSSFSNWSTHLMGASLEIYVATSEWDYFSSWCAWYWRWSLSGCAFGLIHRLWRWPSLIDLCLTFCFWTDLQSSQIVATGSILIEHKFVRNCGKVSSISELFWVNHILACTILCCWLCTFGDYQWVQWVQAYKAKAHVQVDRIQTGVMYWPNFKCNFKWEPCAISSVNYTFRQFSGTVYKSSPTSGEGNISRLFFRYLRIFWLQWFQRLYLFRCDLWSQGPWPLTTLLDGIWIVGKHILTKVCNSVQVGHIEDVVVDHIVRGQHLGQRCVHCLPSRHF